ncbi:serine/threonine protein kinase [Crateriforma spongiae]|uniref:serine/threonine protein kinase n=1 Tax=Crateriforma spongiae TaxID=2724528 RepID=UPI001445ACD3|nr:serine/threonine-protein kinase [Crateriforma spongiae]
MKKEPPAATSPTTDARRIADQLKSVIEQSKERPLPKPASTEAGESIDEKLTLFHTAALHSELISEQVFARAVDIAKRRLKAGGSDGPVDAEAVAAALIQSGVITSYQAQQLRSGRSKLTLGPYLITDWIGQGGMGQVFKAVHRVMGRECAVKVLPLEKSTEESRASFMREIRLQAGLDHPQLVRAFDAGRDGNVHYLVTEYVPGTDLRKYVRRHGPLPVHQAASIISQAARGLQYAHELGLIHRDVKPGNILVTPDGVAKVSDVGLAAWSMGIHEDPRAGKIVGTADYLSPEQIRSPLMIGPASDIYSLGCTTYYVVTGKVPFPGGDSRSKCRRHCEQTPWHPRKFAPELPEEFVDAIADMMEKDPERRVASAADVADRLEPFARISDAAIDPPIRRQAWTAPPPPMENGVDEDHVGLDGRSGPNVEEDSVAGSASAESQGSTDTPPPVPGGDAAIDADDPMVGNSLSSLQTAPRPSHTLAIAITLALAVPVSLLIGAVLGFLAHEYWQF